MAETRFSSVTREMRNGREAIVHNIDQFSWFKQGMNNCLEELPYEYFSSAVEFSFPDCVRHLTVKGKDHGICSAYFNSDDLIKVFEYRRNGENIFVPEKAGFINLKIFTTKIDPFLDSAEYSQNALRIYRLDLLESDCLEVAVSKGKSLEEDSMTLSYLSNKLPERRKDFLEFKIRDGKWIFEEIK